MYLLSQRAVSPSPGWHPIYDLENMIARLCGAQIMAPELRIDRHRMVHSLVRRAVGSYRKLPIQPQGQPSVLIVFAHLPDRLDLLEAVEQWRRRFDIVAAFVTDSHWSWDRVARLANHLDHLFVPIRETVEPIQATTGVATHLLPFAMDMLNHGSASDDRTIDIASYGRQPRELHQALQQRFNQPGSARIYLHSPFGFRKPDDWQMDRLLFWKLLRRAQVAMAFDTIVDGRRAVPHNCSIVTPRWFECLGSGCIVAGGRPRTSLFDELFDWPDSMIDLPEDIDAAVERIESLLARPDELATMRRRNYRHMLARHDWRYRIDRLIRTLGITIPAPLKRELATLAERVRAVQHGRIIDARHSAHALSDEEVIG